MKIFSGKEKNWNIDFVYSPFFEMICSIHVLINPDHHLGRLIWAKKMRRNISDELFKELVEIGQHTFDWCIIMDICNIHEDLNDVNVVTSIDYIQKVPIKDFNYQYSKYKSYGDAKFDEKLRKKIMKALKEYYLSFFEKELRFVEPLLVRSLESNSQKCMRIGILDYIGSLHNRIEVTEEAFLNHTKQL